MSESDLKQAKPLRSISEESSLLPDELAADVRRLSHDLSNALEIIVQTS